MTKHLNFVSALVLAASLQWCVFPSTTFAADLTLNAAGTWASAGGQDSSNVANASAGDNVDITANAAFTVTNDGTADDGSGNTNTFTLGNITNSANSASTQIRTGSSNDLTVTVNSVQVNSSFTVENVNAHDSANTTTVTGAVTAGSLNVTNSEQDTDVDVTLTIGGNLSVTGTSTLLGFTNTGTDALLNLNGATNTSGNFSLDDNTGRAILTFGGTTQSVTGVISGASAGEGAVIVDGTDVTFNSNIGGTRLRSFTVNASKKAQLGAATLSATTITNNGTLEFDTAVTATGTTFELNGSGTDSAGALTMGASSYTGNTMINATGVTNVNATNVVQVNPHANFLSGTVTLIDGPGTGAGTADDLAKFSVADNNVLASYSLAIANTDDVTLTATQASSDSVATSLSTTKSSADALIQGFDATTGDSTVNTAYQSVLGNTNNAAQAAEQSGPDQTGSVGTATLSVGDITFNTISSHLTDIRNTSIYTAGSLVAWADGGGYLQGLWARPFIFHGDQNELNQVPGYETDTAGIALGWDYKVKASTRLGVGFSYADTEVDSDGAGDNQSDIESYQLFGYAEWVFPNWYLELMAGYGFNDIEGSRQINFGGLTRIASSAYEANQFFTRLEWGRPIHLGKRIIVTPTLGFDYAYLDADSYTETGAGVLNLNVSPESKESSIFRTGANLYTNKQLGSGTLTPEVRAGFGYDLDEDNLIATSTFTSGGASFETQGNDAARWEWSLGSGFAWKSDEGAWTLSLDYDVIGKEEYLGHSGRIEVIYRY